MRSRDSGGREVERIRERLLSTGGLDTARSNDEPDLTPGVLDSWRRSQVRRVHPDRADLRFVREPNRGSALVRAADPVLQRATDDLAAEAVSVILTSADGVVIERSAADNSILAALDTISLAPGYSLAEDVAGTNGIGTTLETERSTFVRGGEHYCSMFSGFACAGSPIRDPMTNKVVGAVNLSCLADGSNPLLLALATSASRHIEDRLQVVAHESETALLEAYLRQTQRYLHGVLAISRDVVLMNSYLRRTLDATDQAALLGHAADLHSATRIGTGVLVLPSGNTATITVADRSAVRGRAINIVFQVDVSSRDTSLSRPLGRPMRTRIPGLAGRDNAWLRSCEEVRQHCRARDWVMIEGEKGSGRTRLAQAVGRYVQPGRNIRILRSEASTSAATFVAELAAELDGENFLVVIADVDDMDPDTLGPMASMLEARAGRGWVAATKSPSSPPVFAERLLPLFAHTVAVPALRHRVDDLEELVPHLLREITRGADVRLAPAAMSQLSRLPWPGNVSQLRRVLTETVARQRSGVITADKLPPECRSVTTRRLTQLEALQRDAIVRSLQDHDGNKQEAARALGMSRATIYRKINDYGIG